MDRLGSRDIVTIADLTDEDWAGYDRVQSALAHRLGFGVLMANVSGGRIRDCREERRVHLKAGEKPSSAAQRLQRGIRTLVIGK